MDLSKNKFSHLREFVKAKKTPQKIPGYDDWQVFQLRMRADMDYIGRLNVSPLRWAIKID